MELLTAYAWPGNIRELQNAIERAFAISPAREIGRDSLPAPIIDTSARASATPSMPVTQAVERAPSDNGSSPPATNPFTEPMSLAEAERFNIAAALRKSAGNKNEAARILGIDRQRLYRKIAKYGLE
jgi:DNA-binding NtrC family response regulator